MQALEATTAANQPAEKKLNSLFRYRSV